jgi:hypothetical protein
MRRLEFEGSRHVPTSLVGIRPANEGGPVRLRSG